MFFDVYMIVITAFAIFGLYSLIEGIVVGIRCYSANKAVTVVKYDDEISTFNTIEYINNTLYNNQIIVVSDQEVTGSQLDIIPEKELHKYITNALFTKN